MHSESQHLEYKRELTDALEREVVGFLNSREGGRILIGVDDAGTLLGLADPDGDQLKIKDRLKQNIQPSCLGLFDQIEYLGSGMPRILRTYPKNCFRFSENFTRMIFPFTAQDTPQATDPVTTQSGLESGQEFAQVTAQVTAQVGRFCQEPRTAREIM
jgi:predicted HTH transcriptional regulator